MPGAECGGSALEARGSKVTPAFKINLRLQKIVCGERERKRMGERGRERK